MLFGPTWTEIVTILLLGPVGGTQGMGRQPAFEALIYDSPLYSMVEDLAGQGRLAPLLEFITSANFRFPTDNQWLPPTSSHMAERLAFKYETNTNVNVINLDARHFGSDSHTWLSDGNYKVVGNLPYYAANPIVRNFLESTHKPTSMVIMVQREVARDMAAEPGHMSLLSLAVQIYASANKVIDVPPQCFDPPPKVHSSVLKLSPSSEPKLRFESPDDFFKLARGGFKSPRKQLHNSLADGLFIHLDDARSLVSETGLETTRRPATLSLEDWQVLYDVWVKSGKPSNIPGSVRRSQKRKLDD